jgi:hypothetical protein
MTNLEAALAALTPAQRDHFLAWLELRDAAIAAPGFDTPNYPQLEPTNAELLTTPGAVAVPESAGTPPGSSITLDAKARAAPVPFPADEAHTGSHPEPWQSLRTPAAVTHLESNEAALHSSNDSAQKKCLATTAAGQPCRAFARAGHHLCIYHDPAYKQQLRASAGQGGSAVRRKSYELVLDGLPVTDRYSIAQAAGAVMRMLVNNTLTDERADHILRALSMAERNLR